MSFFKKVKKTAKQIGQATNKGLIKSIAKNPERLLVGAIDPIGTKIANTLTGKDWDPAVNQLGGPTGKTLDDINASGTTRGIFKGADLVAGAFGGAGAANGLGAAYGSIGGGAGGAAGTGAAGTGAAGAGGAGSAGGGLVNGMSTGDLINLGGGLAGAGLDYLGNRQATRAQTAADQAAIDEMRRQFDITQANLKPWLDDGTRAIGQMNDPNGYTDSPGYEFRKRGGSQMVQGSAAASGGLYSGNTLKALTQYGDNLAADEYNNWWNRLASRAGIGQTTATNLGQIGGNTSRDISSLLSNAGASRASGIRGAYGAVGSGLGAVAGGLDTYFANQRKINPYSIYDYSTQNGGQRYA